MSNYKRKHRRGHSSCGLCKPHKKAGCRGQNKSCTMQERKVKQREKYGFDKVDS